MSPDTNTEIFCGVARLPREMSAAEPSAYLAIEIEVDMERQVVTDLAFTACPSLCETIVKRNLIGRDPVDGIPEVKSMMERRYHGVAKGALMAALENSLQAYLGRVAMTPC